MRKSSKTAIAAIVAVVLVGTGTAAWAWWSTGSNGVGFGNTASRPADVIGTMTTKPASLVPGGASQPISGAFYNGGNKPERVSGMKVTISSVVGAAGSTCSAADFTITQPTNVADTDIGATATGGSWSGSIVMNFLPRNQTDCSAAVVNYLLTVS